MEGYDLPSRAKPEALHKLCKHLRENGPAEKTRLYDRMEIDRRQIRASIQYGVELGFLGMEGDTVSVTENGHTLGLVESLGEGISRRVFREAIGAYKPYREAFLWIDADDLVEDVKGNLCVTQSSIQESFKKITKEEHSPRTINLFIKTARAAGLGEFVTGRKGLETRLETNEEFNEFMQKLIEEYERPASAGSEQAKPEKESGDGNEDTSAKSAPANRVETEGLKITAEWDVSDKSDEEIANLISEIRRMGVDSLGQ